MALPDGLWHFQRAYPTFEGPILFPKGPFYFQMAVFGSFAASCVAFGRLWAPSLAMWGDLKRLEKVFGWFVGGLGGPKGVSRGARERA